MKKQTVFQPNMMNGIPEIAPAVLAEKANQVLVIDVRGRDEFDGELGHIDGAQLVTLGPQLVSFLEGRDRDEEIVFVCRSGGRSGQATALSLQMGFKNTRNMAGGMMTWNMLSLPVKRA